MAPTKQTLTLISISILLFSTLYAKETSSPSRKLAAPNPIEPPSTNGDKVVTKKLQLMEKQISLTNETFGKMLKNPYVVPDETRCINACQVNYENAIGHARVAIELVNKADLAKAKPEITFVFTDIEKGYNCFQKNCRNFPPDIESQDMQKWVKEVIGECLMDIQT